MIAQFDPPLEGEFIFTEMFGGFGELVAICETEELHCYQEELPPEPGYTYSTSSLNS